MKRITLKLFGGRIESMKYSLKQTIKRCKDNGQDDMAIIYETMLREIEQAEREAVDE